MSEQDIFIEGDMVWISNELDYGKVTEVHEGKVLVSLHRFDDKVDERWFDIENMEHLY